MKLSKFIKGLSRNIQFIVTQASCKGNKARNVLGKGPHLCNSLVLVGFLSFQSCGYRKFKQKDQYDNFFISQERLQSISYNEVKNKVFNPKCIQCHGQSGNINLENYETTKQALDKIKESVFKYKSMPPSSEGPLNSNQYETLLAWIRAQGPNNPLNGSKPPEIGIEKLEPKFLSIKKLIIDKKCISCHRKDGEAHNVSLDTVDDMINSPLEVIIPGNPDESGLILSFLPDSTNYMPPKDSEYSPLKPNEVEIIRQWIFKGAKD